MTTGGVESFFLISSDPPSAKFEFGIICVSPENLGSPWLLFESGALAKTIEKTFVCPYLIDLDKIEPEHPLSQFQFQHADKEGTYVVVRTIHKALLATNKEADLTESQVAESFKTWWSKLDEKLRQIPSAPATAAEPEPDDMGKVLKLIEGIAQSVSALQGRIESAPYLQSYASLVSAGCRTEHWSEIHPRETIPNVPYIFVRIATVGYLCLT